MNWFCRIQVHDLLTPLHSMAVTGSPIETALPNESPRIPEEQILYSTRPRDLPLKRPPDIRINPGHPPPVSVLHWGPLTVDISNSA